MKKLIAILFMVIMLTGCSVIKSQTPFLGGFVDDSPPYLVKIHNDILDRLIPVPGTASFEHTVLGNGEIAGYITPDGRKGWCSNYAAAVKEELFKAGASGWDFGWRVSIQ
jgi:hypothetical protein